MAETSFDSKLILRTRSPCLANGFLVALLVMVCCQAQGESFEQFERRMGAFFDPKPGSTIRIDPNRYLNRIKADNYFETSIPITVNPPAGRCFTIEARPSDGEQRICAKTVIEARLADLTPTGILEWKIVEPQDQFQKSLFWHSPHRVGKFIDFTMEWPGPSRLLWVRDCAFKGYSGEHRLYTLSFFSKKDFSLRLPKKDIPIPKPLVKMINSLAAIAKGAHEAVTGTQKPKGGTLPEPEPLPEDMVVPPEAEIAPGAEEGTPPDAVTVVEHQENPNQKSTGPMAGKPDPEVRKEFVGTKRSVGDTPMADEYRGRERDPTRLWNITWRKGFFTEGANIVAGTDSTPGSLGFCRYSYSGYRTDKASPALECKMVGEYKWFYLPFTCLKPEQATNG